MGKIKITCDSTCDLTAELYEKYDVEVLPLGIMLGETLYHDGVDVTAKDVFAYVKKTGVLPKTSAVSVGEYTDVFQKYTDQGYSVIHINISSELSACHQNARLATEELEGVYPVDSRNLSTGSGLLVIAAAEMAQQGHSAQEIVERLEALREKVDASFVLQTLEYLKKGGRCSSVAALGARALQLRPEIRVADGGMGVGKKYRGNYSKCLSTYVKERLEGRSDLDSTRIFITWTSVSDDALTQVRQAVSTYGSFETVLESVAGSTISCHCGPGTLGILFVRK